jgi:Uma2 family endonuclease
MNAALQLDTPRRLWLRVEDFLLLNDSGAFDDVAKTELIDGEIICMNSQFQRHSYAKSEMAYCLRTALGADRALVVLVEVAIAMPPHDMPEPDIVIMRGPLGDGPVVLDQVALVVEVAETTRDNDLGRKATLYARGGIPEYWVVDLQNAEIVRHWQPVGEAYGTLDRVAFGADLASVTLPALIVATSGLA